MSRYLLKNIIMNNRFEIIEKSKFEKLTNKELREIKGGLCLSCLKKAKKLRVHVDIWAHGTIKG